MKKETKKKNTKIMNKKEFYGKTTYSEETKRVVKIAVTVVVILTLVYLLTALATGEIKLGSEKKEIKEPTIQYEEIIAGEIMNRKEEEYYVMTFAFTDKNASKYISLKDTYSKEEKSLPVYLVDLDSAFNKKIIAEEAEKFTEKPSKISDLKVNGATVLKIKNGKVVERVEGEEQIKALLSK